MDLARTVAWDRARAETLAGLGAHLPGELLSEAWDVADAIPELEARATALTVLARHLPREDSETAFQDVLAAARAIAPAKRLTTLLPDLPAECRRERDPSSSPDLLDRAADHPNGIAPTPTGRLRDRPYSPAPTRRPTQSRRRGPANPRRQTLAGQHRRGPIPANIPLITAKEQLLKGQPQNRPHNTLRLAVAGDPPI